MCCPTRNAFFGHARRARLHQAAPLFLIIIESVALSQSLWQLLGILPPSMITENLGHNLQAGLALILYPLQVSIFLFSIQP